MNLDSVHLLPRTRHPKIANVTDDNGIRKTARSRTTGTLIAIVAVVETVNAQSTIYQTESLRCPYHFAHLKISSTCNSIDFAKAALTWSPASSPVARMNGNTQRATARATGYTERIKLSAAQRPIPKLNASRHAIAGSVPSSESSSND